MEELHIKKHPFAVTLYLVDGTVESGTMFAAHQSATHGGEETVQDIMDDPTPMLPFMLRGEQFQLIGKTGVAAVQSVASTRPEGFFDRVFASVRLRGGHSFDGQLLLEEGQGHRVSDALANDEWLRIETAGGFVWARRDYVLRLTTR